MIGSLTESKVGNHKDKLHFIEQIGVDGMTEKMTKEIVDRIFKEPGIKYELTEFENLGKSIYNIFDIYSKTVETGRDAGKTKYYLKSFVPFSSGKDEVQVYVDGGKSAPEEIVRQLWVYKLIHQYGCQPDEINLEKSVQFGTVVSTKADINVYTDDKWILKWPTVPRSFRN